MRVFNLILNNSARGFIFGVFILISINTFYFVRPTHTYALCRNSFEIISNALQRAVNGGASLDQITKIISVLTRQITECDETGRQITGSPSPILLPTLPPNPNEIALAEAITYITLASCFHNYPSDNPDKGLIASVVSRENIDCINGFISIMPQSALDTFKAFIHWNYKFDYMQCTNCAAGFGAARGRPYVASGHAKAHANQPVNGYTWFDSKPENYGQIVEGSMFVKTNGTYGHVGVIIEVLRDSDNNPTSIRVFDCNAPKNGNVRSTHIYHLSEIDGWQRPDNLNLPTTRPSNPAPTVSGI